MFHLNGIESLHETIQLTSPATIQLTSPATDTSTYIIDTDYLTVSIGTHTVFISLFGLSIKIDHYRYYTIHIILCTMYIITVAHYYVYYWCLHDIGAKFFMFFSSRIPLSAFIYLLYVIVTHELLVPQMFNIIVSQSYILYNLN